MRLEYVALILAVIAIGAIVVTLMHLDGKCKGRFGDDYRYQSKASLCVNQKTGEIKGL